MAPRRRRRAAAFAAAALASLVAASATAAASRGPVQLVSTGSKADTGQFPARFLTATADGRKAFFLTAEQLVPADTNSSDDIYLREAGVTTLISTGPTGRSGGVVVSERRGKLAWFDVSDDGEHVLFTTDAALVDADTDVYYDVYERFSAQTSLISSSSVEQCLFPTGCDSFMGAASADGNKVAFVTAENLVAQDTDGICVDSFSGDLPCYDVYERSDGATRLVSLGSLGGNGGPHGEGDNSSFEGASTDGSRIFFSTREALEPGDDDTGCLTGATDGPRCWDIYERSSGSTKLITPGPVGGDSGEMQIMQGLSDDGKHVFAMAGVLVVEPWGQSTDWDIWDHSPSGTELLTGGMDTSEFFGRLRFTPDGSRVFLETRAPLIATDTDGELDVYRRSHGQITLISVGESGNGFRPARLAGFSRDGSRVFFETDERLTAADTDDYGDVYRRSGTKTVLLSGSGEFGPAASFLGASPDGTDAFFKTEESLSPVDRDSAQDVYESHADEITLVSVGGTPAPGPVEVRWGGASDNGSHAFFLTDERLVPADQDSQQDVYAAFIEAPDAPPTSQSVTGPPPQQPPAAPFGLKVGLKNRYRLRSLLHGLAVPVECSLRCTARISLKLSRRAAGRLGLRTADVVLGARTVALPGARAVSVEVNLSKRVARRLRKARFVRLKVEVTARDGAGHGVARTRRILFRR